MAEYMESDFTKEDAEHLDDVKIPTYDKNTAEKQIAKMEKKFGKISEERKQAIRDLYVYVGKE